MNEKVNKQIHWLSATTFILKEMKSLLACIWLIQHMCRCGTTVHKQFSAKLYHVCYLQNIKYKSKPVIPSKDSKTLDKVCKRFLMPKIRHEVLTLKYHIFFRVYLGVLIFIQTNICSSVNKGFQLHSSLRGVKARQRKIFEIRLLLVIFSYKSE